MRSKTVVVMLALVFVTSLFAAAYDAFAQSKKSSDQTSGTSGSSSTMVGTMHAAATQPHTAVQAEAIAKGKPFEFAGVVESVDVQDGTMVVATPNTGYITFRLDFARFEGKYAGAKDVAVGDKIVGMGTTVNGQDFVQRMVEAPGSC